MPFIRHHYDVFRELKIDWCWHIVEGGADLKNDTSWSVVNGGKVPSDLRNNTLSTDGTSQYIDNLKQLDPNRISVYRKTLGQLWNGKLEMVSAPLENISEECLLWQIDVDEFWSADQITAIHEEFIKDPSKTSAWFWCNYYVAPDIVVTTRNCYSQNPQQEWLRTWRFLPGDHWNAHEPPTLVRRMSDGSNKDVGRINPIFHSQTEKLGCVFDHHSYVLESQVAFKEQYYGYKDALLKWNALQKHEWGINPVRLSEYFPWVKDFTYVDKSLPKYDGASSLLDGSMPPMVLVDGVAFQFTWTTAIKRVWCAIFQEWVSSGFSKYVTVLDRAGTFPEIPGINKIPFPEWSEKSAALDSFKIEKECHKRHVEAFVSTYYTSPIRVPSVSLNHDFIPEVLGSPMKGGLWREKILQIYQASAHVCVSYNTALDLKKHYEVMEEAAIFTAHLGTCKGLVNATESDVYEFKHKYNVTKPYFLFVGERVGLLGEPDNVSGYKNASLVLNTFESHKLYEKYDLVFVGGAEVLEPSLKALLGQTNPKLIRAEDDELSAAYSGAVALIYPSFYEGFGLPVLEAMSCRCPVICSDRASLPEVAGEAALYINPEIENSLFEAITKIEITEVREELIRRGTGQSEKFDFKNIGKKMMEALDYASKHRSRKARLAETIRQIQVQGEGFRSENEEYRKTPLINIIAFIFRNLKRDSILRNVGKIYKTLNGEK
jgi:glycosyltransferase involved in cell wall biosynthesis